MNLTTLENDIAADVRHLARDLTTDLKAEALHIADPSQCGSIVRRHFDGLTFTLLLFVALFLASAAVGIFVYIWR